MIKHLILLCSFIYSSLAAQTVSILSIQKEWTDETVSHFFYVTPSNFTQTDTVSIQFYHHKKLLFSASKIITEKSQQTKFEFARQKQDTITDYSVKHFYNGEINVQISDYAPYMSEAVSYSPIFTYLKNDNQLIPISDFLKEKDTVSLDFMTEFRSAKKTDRLGYEFSIVSSNNDTLNRLYSKVNSSDRIMNRIDIPAKILNPGRYHFVIAFYNNNHLLKLEKSNNFYIVSGEKSASSMNSKSKNASLFQNILASYSKDELDDLFRKIYFLVTKEEKALYENLLDVQSKRQFLAAFWEKREGIPGQNFNDVLDKIAFVNSKFSIPGKPGYLTDKGRVYLIYGSCDDIYVSPSSSNIKPFEVWYYPSVESGVRFYFVDLNGFGEMKLIHSTAKNEVSNLGAILRLGIDPIDYRQ